MPDERTSYYENMLLLDDLETLAEEMADAQVETIAELKRVSQDEDGVEFAEEMEALGFRTLAEVEGRIAMLHSKFDEDEDTAE